MTLRRMLLVAKGSGTFASPNPWFVVTSPSDGAWSWFGDPRSLNHDSYSYLGYVDGSGNVCVRVLADGAETPSSEIVLHAALDVDDHVNPSFAVLPNGKLAAWYCRHEPASTTPHQRISVNTLAADPTLSGGFGAETNLDAQLGGTSYDYPVPFVFGSRVYLFFRNIPSGSSYRLIRSYSDDNGATWAAMTTVAVNTTGTGRAYWKLWEDAGNVHIAYNNGTPGIDTTYLYHFYWDESAGTYHQSDGTTISAALPLAAAHMTPVQTSNNCWIYDVAIDPIDGFPRMVYAVYPTQFSDHRYRYARWTGSAWTTSEICAAGNGLDVTVSGSPPRTYSGGVILDKADPNIVYASREGSGIFEMWRFITTDDGATWTGAALTSGSAVKHVRPYAVTGTDLVVWSSGTYTSYSNFNLGITGYRP